MTASLLKMPIALAHAWWYAVSQTLKLAPQARAMLGFTLRTFGASMLALYIAFALQLESPVWAWLTAWIVQQASPGMAISKGFFRGIGTILGSIWGIILIALFAQTPELFVLALAVFVGACTVLFNLFTNFRAYAAGLTAYTAGIVASDAINAPDQVFFIAMARGSCILLGIASVVVVNALFAPHRSAAAARAKLLTALKDVAERAAYPWSGANENRVKIGRKLIAELIELNTVIEYAAAESATFRIQANRARSLIAHIFSIISARRALDARLARCGWPEYHALEIFHEVILDFLHEMPARLDKGELDELIDGLAEVRQQLELLRPEKETVESDDLVLVRLVIDRIDDLLFQLDGALNDWRIMVKGGWSPAPGIGLDFHRDVRAAWINGLRAFLAVLATGAFWIGSAWPNGPGALVFVCVMLSIFSNFPHPDKVGWTFLKAGTFATVMAVFCKFYVLNGGSGFEYLTFAVGLFLIPLGLAIANPSTALPSAAFMFVFLSLVGPANAQTYNLSETLNTAVATLGGILFSTLVYILVFPPSPAAARHYVTYRIRRGLEMISLLDPVPVTSSRWETRMYDRVMRLNDPNNPSGTPTDEWLDAGLGALNLGNEILRLRRWLETETMSVTVRASATKVIEAFGRFLPEPARACAVVREQMQHLALHDPGAGNPERLSWARVLGALEEMHLYLVAHPRLTTIEG